MCVRVALCQQSLVGPYTSNKPGHGTEQQVRELAAAGLVSPLLWETTRKYLSLSALSTDEDLQRISSP